MTEASTIYLLDVASGEGIEAELRAAGVDVVDVAYGRAATYTLAFAPGERERVDALLAAATHGGAEAKDAGHRWVERGG